MGVMKKKILGWFLLFLLSVSVVLFFGKFCVLRPYDSQHPYKEYLSGLIVLALVGVNVLLFRLNYGKGRQKQYFLWTFLSIVAALLAEMLMVGVDIFPKMSAQFPRSSAMAFLAVDVLYVFLRDAAFALLAATLQTTQYYRRRFSDSEAVMLHEFKRIEAEDLKTGDIVVANIADVSYVMQSENYSYLYLSTGSVLCRHGSLKSIAELLCPLYAAQISRKVLVFYDHVSKYSQTGVVVKSAKEDVILPLSENYAAKALVQLEQHVEKKMKKSRRKSSREAVPSGETAAMEKIEQYRTSILHFIMENPGCSASEVKKNRSISQSTVNRILAQLKKEGLIEYRGSKKYGGYVVVDS